MVSLSVSSEEFVRSRFRAQMDAGMSATGVSRGSSDEGEDDGCYYDSPFKIMLIGDSAVGKTAAVVRYCENRFAKDYVATVGIDFKRKTTTISGKRVKLQIWDTAGQERFRSITHTYFKGAMGMLLVYDVSKEASFNSVRSWVDSIKKFAPEACSIVLVGQKCDLQDEGKRAVSRKRAEKLAHMYSIMFIETSAKTGDNIDRAFEMLAQSIANTIDEHPGPIEGFPRRHEQLSVLRGAPSGKDVHSCCTLL